MRLSLEALDSVDELDIEVGLEPFDGHPVLRQLSLQVLAGRHDRTAGATAARMMMELGFTSGCSSEVYRWLDGVETQWGDMATLAWLLPTQLEAERVARVMPQRSPAHPNAVHGTPVTPEARLGELRGASFCVSYFAPYQLEKVIPLLGPGSWIMADNGAFSAWRAGLVLDAAYWDGFWRWAFDLLARCDQAIAVIPDVIEGSPEENWALIEDALDRAPDLVERMMPVWHMYEPLEQLERMVLAGFRWIAIGSSGEQYSTLGTPAWDARIDEAFAVIERACNDFDELHPRVHLMRGLGQLPRGRHAFSSADSTNLARNHSRQARRGEDIATFRSRVEASRFPVPDRPVWPHSSVDVTAPPRCAVQGALF